MPLAKGEQCILSNSEEDTFAKLVSCINIHDLDGFQVVNLQNYNGQNVIFPADDSSPNVLITQEGMSKREEAMGTMSPASGDEINAEKSCGQNKAESEETGNRLYSWTYEDQFKQLYELSDDPGRRVWLDDWFQFMHQRGKTVTRIPIMAKKVMDMFELYRLVVQRGGLVEVINKKLWREITTGMNLPSSITSAAFTLRTQYQKYLFEYECKRHNFSTWDDLNVAVEGIKRRGSRPLAQMELDLNNQNCIEQREVDPSIKAANFVDIVDSDGYQVVYWENKNEDDCAKRRIVAADNGDNGRSIFI